MSIASILWLLAIAVVAGTLFLAFELVYLLLVIQWSDRRTAGANYCAAPLDERRRFQKQLQLHARLLAPLLWLLRKTKNFRIADATFHFQAVAGPRGGACNEASFERAALYHPQPQDVFVVTQMRCGTTWMQHLAFQALTRGMRDLANEETTLSAVSPWLESNKTVDVAAAPLVGNDAPSRVIKTHLPASLCPFDPRAKYIYVMRHPVSCFASCVDFVRSNARCFDVGLDDLARWYTSSDAMWWGTWASHFAGWYARAEQEQNILLVRFEDMKQNMNDVIHRVADFLYVPTLSEDECQNVLTKCSFQYMHEHAAAFEMHPPHLLQVPESFFVSGKADRFSDVPQEIHDELIRRCRAELADHGVPIERFYPELAVPAEALA